MIEITVPEISPLVLSHYEQAKAAHGDLASYRQYDSTVCLRSFRIQLVSINTAAQRKFIGAELTTGQTTFAPLGALILVHDYSYAKAKWYAARYIAPISTETTLCRATETGLEIEFETNRRTWSNDVINFVQQFHPEISVVHDSWANYHLYALTAPDIATISRS